jgi:hypothetical protein
MTLVVERVLDADKRAVLVGAEPDRAFGQVERVLDHFVSRESGSRRPRTCAFLPTWAPLAFDRAIARGPPQTSTPPRPATCSRGVLVVSQDERVTEMADQVLTLEDGRITRLPTR